MPRAPKLGPAILKIEQLNTGAEWREPIWDDFSGAPLQPITAPPKGPIADAQLAIDAANRAKQAQAAALLYAVGITGPKPAKRVFVLKRRV